MEGLLALLGLGIFILIFPLLLFLVEVYCDWADGFMERWRRK